MIKLLIVDDSALMRRLLTEIFTDAGDFVIQAAKDGFEAIALVKQFAPDVVTLDVQMPGMDGLACLDQIMLLRPCPVVMVSALTAEGADETLEAMALGAVDFVAKPKGAVSIEIEAVASKLVETVRSAAGTRISLAIRLRDRVRAQARRSPEPFTSLMNQGFRAGDATAQRITSPVRPGIVLVGCSTGGPPALELVLRDLPASFPWPIVIAQHMPATFTGSLARRLNGLTALTVQEVDRPMSLSPGHAYIGRGDADLLLSRRKGLPWALPAPSSIEHYWHPSVDRLVESAMGVTTADRLIGILMTGMGTDGAVAMTNLRQSGGMTIAESRQTAVVWGMPGALIEQGGATMERPVDMIGGELMAALCL